MRTLRTQKKKNYFKQINYPFLIVFMGLMTALMFLLRNTYEDLQLVDSRLNAGYEVVIGNNRLPNGCLTAKDVVLYDFEINDKDRQIKLFIPKTYSGIPNEES